METNPVETPMSGPVQIPGRVSNGGIDKMLAPRTPEQQARFSVKIDAHKHGYPADVHERNERIRNNVPIIGGWVADKLHQRMKGTVALARAADSESLLR